MRNVWDTSPPAHDAICIAALDREVLQGVCAHVLCLQRQPRARLNAGDWQAMKG